MSVLIQPSVIALMTGVVTAGAVWYAWSLCENIAVWLAQRQAEPQAAERETPRRP